jgi:hypothetical protein
MLLHDVGQYGDAVEGWHAHVRNDDIEVLTIESLQGGTRRALDLNVPFVAQWPEHTTHGIE